jgi:uncharacterized membrane protein HdeD (DUF308 family)
MTSLQPTRIPDVTAVVAKALHEHWHVLLVEGIILLVLGAAAIIIPPLAGIAATIWIGAIFLLGGIVGLVASLRARQAPGFGWAVVSATLALLAGLLLLWNPIEGLVTLTYVMIAFFIFDGLTMIFYAIAHRHELSGRWEWILTNGLIDLFLAAIILSGMPGSSIWALGLLLGIDLVFGGSALVAVALAAKKAPG